MSLEFTIFETLSGIIANTEIRFEGILYVVLLSILIIGAIGLALWATIYSIKDIIDTHKYGCCLEMTTVPFLIAGPSALFGTILLMTNITPSLPFMLTGFGFLTIIIIFMFKLCGDG